MTGDPKPRDYDDLSVPEKNLRIQDLWDEIARSPQDVEVTPAQLDEAERRLRDYRREPRDLTSWDEFRRRLEREA